MAVEPDSLPGPVRRFVQRVLPTGSSTGRRVRIEQVGDMTLEPGARPRRFSATEEFAASRVAFAWNARFPMLGPIALRVTDGYDAGEGRLDVRLLGLPLQRRRGPELARGEVLRYLAEIAWMPQAIVDNDQLQWREVDERAVEVVTPVRGEEAAVRLVFNEAGEISQTIAERPRLEAAGAMTPWVGEFRDYRTFDGVCIPARGEVRWELPDGPYTYWRATITSFALVD